MKESWANTSESFTPYDRADYLTGTEDVVAYLEAAIEEAGDDPAFIAQALGTIARSGNLSEPARRAGMNREGLYEALSAGWESEFRHEHEGRSRTRPRIHFESVACELASRAAALKCGELVPKFGGGVVNTQVTAWASTFCKSVAV